MTRSDTRSRHRPRQTRNVMICLSLALASPLLVFIAIAGLKTGIWGIATAYDLLTWRAGVLLAGLGLIAALVAIGIGLTAPRQSGLIALLTVVVSSATVGLFWREFENGRLNPAREGDAYSNIADPPGFPAAIMAERHRSGENPIPFGTGQCDVQAVPSQVAPGVAGYALQKAGFTIRTLGVGRAVGIRETFWFDRTHDAVVRIRPGRTDVRVWARDALRDRGEACRLANSIVENLQ